MHFSSSLRGMRRFPTLPDSPVISLRHTGDILVLRCCYCTGLCGLLDSRRSVYKYRRVSLKDN